MSHLCKTVILLAHIVQSWCMSSRLYTARIAIVSVTLSIHSRFCVINSWSKSWIFRISISMMKCTLDNKAHEVDNGNRDYHNSKDWIDAMRRFWDRLYVFLTHVNSTRGNLWLSWFQQLSLCQWSEFCVSRIIRLEVRVCLQVFLDHQFF